MRKKGACAIVLLALLNLAAMPLTYFDPKENEKEFGEIGGSAILLETGEKLVLYPQYRFHAISVIVLVGTNYERTLRELLDIVSNKYGIADQGEFREQQDAPKQSKGQIDQLKWPYGPLLGKGFVEFRKIGIRIDQPKEYWIQTKKYNQIEKISGYSELELRMINGKDIFGKECALIAIKRTDHSREWMRHFQFGIPLPFKGPRKDEVVTDSEIRLVEDLISRVGKAKTEYFIPYPGYQDEKYWVEFMNGIKEAANGFGKKNGSG